MSILWKGNGILLPVYAFAGAVIGILLQAKHSGAGIVVSPDSINAALAGTMGGTWLYMLVFGGTKLHVETRRNGEQYVRRERPSLLTIPVVLWTMVITLACGGLFLFRLIAPLHVFGGGPLAQAALGEGEGSLAAVEKWLDRDLGSRFAGNSDLATEFAEEFSVSMNRIRSSGFESDDGSSAVVENGFRTYCFLGEQTSAFIVVMPDLRNFDEGGRRIIIDGAWWLGKSIGRELNPRPDQLAIGFRARGSYDTILTGSLEAHGPNSLGDPALLLPFFTGDGHSEQPGIGSPNEQAPEPLPRPAVKTLPTALRSWMATDGRPMEARLMGVSHDRPALARFERADGKTFTIAIDRFIPEHQRQILELRPKIGLVDYRAYHGLLGEDYAGNAFVIQYKGRLVACMTRHQFDDDAVPSKVEDLDIEPVLLDTSKVFTQEDVQLLPLVDQDRPTVQCLAFSPDYVLEAGEELWIERGAQLGSGEGSVGMLDGSGLQDGKYSPSEGPRELAFNLTTPADVRGASGCAVVQVSTGQPIGVFIGADQDEGATRIVFEPICLPGDGKVTSPLSP